MQEKGYVYILTNPSFREDWVKIGMSSRPVDIRSKELDNTAVPLPFEIYATVKTSQYKEIEKTLHKILTDLADARIRKGREFFNIRPEEAYVYLERLARLTGDAEINAPDDIYNLDESASDSKRSSTYKGSYTVNTQEIFYLKNDIADAKMQVIAGTKYVILEGSVIDPNIYSSEVMIKRIRNQHSDCLNADGTTVIKDTEFNSPSAAANFVRGGASNGKVYWRTKNDVPLLDFIEYDN